MSALVKDQKVWLADQEDAYQLGTVRSVTATQVEIVNEKNQILRLKPGDAAKLEVAGSHVDSKREQENLVDLDEFSEGAILFHVRRRFLNKAIYTHVGAILVAVNPFEPLNIYSSAEMMRAQKGVLDAATYPHIFVTAAAAFTQMRTHRAHQSVLISGESGAGKTETTKKVLEYLANMSPGGGGGGGGGDGDQPSASMEKKILQSNPLLEALGNAKTRRNDNSSRFGKWMKVDFDASCRIRGCEIVNYLLEKSRVVGFYPDERNYHIFYQLLAGASPELRQTLGLLEPQDYKYLKLGEKFTVDSMDDVEEFQEVQRAMNTLQIPPTRQMEMFKILAAILALGNVTFSTQFDGQIESNDGGASRRIVEDVSALLQLDPSSLTMALTEKHMYIKGVMQPPQPYTAAQAADNRDALVKSLYSLMFDATIRHINTTLRSGSGSESLSPGSDSLTHIGVLDIFGFEVFPKNSFEQLCINYCNEKLQSHFNSVIFKAEKQMYADEGINTDSISFDNIDNKECVQLIEGTKGKPIGLLCMLDAECSIGNASDVSYVSNIEKAFGEPEAFKSSRLGSKKPCWAYLASHGATVGGGGRTTAAPLTCADPNCQLLHARDITDVFPSNTSEDKVTWRDMCKYATDVFSKNRRNAFFSKNKTSRVCFSVRHFAGSVEYTVGREPKQGELSGFSRDWLDKNSDELSALVVDCMLHSSSSLVQDLFAEKAAALSGGGGLTASNKVSLGGQFRNQLISLLDALEKTEPHFVRCVKSNNQKRGGVFDGHLVLEQLKYAGLFEAIRIRKAGYAYRASHEEFAHQYLILVPGLLREKFKNPQYFNAKDACNRILKQVVERDKVLFPGVAVVGASKVFIKENSHRTELDHCWRAKREIFSLVVSRFVKRFIDYYRTRSEREKLEIEMRRTREIQEKERREAEALAAERARQAVIVQKYVRRFQVRSYMFSIKDLVALRRALDPHNTAENKIEEIKKIIANIEQQHGLVDEVPESHSTHARRISTKTSKESSSVGSGLRQMFAQEVKIARTMMKLIEVQETFRKDMLAAVADCDVVALNKLLVRAERLEMSNDKLVIEARENLRKLHRKRTVMKHMVAFLKNEYESHTDPAELLREAAYLGVDDLFISKVRRVYDGAGPRLHARARLRVAIETVHRSAVEHGLVEIEAMQAFKGRETFAEAERRAGRLLLRFLAFESQLCPATERAGGGLGGGRGRGVFAASTGGGIFGFGSGGVGDDDYGGVGGDNGGSAAEFGDEGARLTAEMISLCDEICSTSSLDAARTAKRRLQQLGGGSTTGLEEIVRCYKWTKLLCTWKYPETRLGSTNDGAAAVSSSSSVGATEYEFFGLRAREARNSVFLIRMLHNDIDPTVAGGEAPPSVQAALGALDLPATVRDTMDKLERSVLRDEAMKQEEAAAAERERAKKAGQNLYGPPAPEKGTGKMTGVTLRRIQASANSITPKKEKVVVKNIKPKATHAYVELSADLEKKLLESRNNLDRQLGVRDDSIVRLDKYKKKTAFRP